MFLPLATVPARRDDAKLLTRTGRGGSSAENSMAFICNISHEAGRYRIVDNLALIDGNYLVLNDAGEHSFQINGAAISEKDLIRLDDTDGNMLCQTSTHLTRTTNVLTLVDRFGSTAGRVQRHPISPLRDRFSIEMDGEPVIFTEGDVSTLEFCAVGTIGAVAEISRRWFRARNSYGVAIAPDQRDAVLLTGIIAIVQLARGTS